MKSKLIILIIIMLINVSAFSQIIDIDTTRLKANLTFLASDDLAGRGSASKSELIAAKFIISEFEKYGIQPYFDTTYLQEFKLVSESNKDSANLMIIKDEEIIVYPHKEEFFVPSNNFVPSDFMAEVVFAGYGITASEYKHDDYKNMNVKDKIVIVLQGEPHWESNAGFEGSKVTKYSQDFKFKRELAHKNGAKAVLIVANGETSKQWGIENDEGRLHEYSEKKNKKEREYKNLPTYYISEKLFSELINSDFSYPELNSKKVYKQLISKSNIERKIELRVKASPKIYTSQNIIGIIPGNDPKLKNEQIVIGAHYDHLGIVNNQIYNGADDNASGTVAVLEMARNSAKLRNNKRSIVYCLWGSEEAGLLGSKYFLDNHDSIHSIKANINLDMIGRGSEDSIYCIYNFDDAYIKNLKKQNKTKNLNIISPQDLQAGVSDYLFFQYNKINIFDLHDKHYQDYHQPTDDTEKINFQKIKKITTLAFNILSDLSNNEFNFDFVEQEEAVDNNYRFGNAFLGMDATMIKGKKIKFCADAKVVNNQGNLWFREDKMDGQTGFFDNMYENPITDSIWRKYEIEGQLSEMAEKIYFGAMLIGKGEFYVDNYKLFYMDEHLEWQEIEIKDSDFEVKEVDDLDKNTWIIRPDKSGEISISDDKKKGKRSLKIFNY